jgi:hypothetical protein
VRPELSECPRSGEFAGIVWDGHLAVLRFVPGLAEKGDRGHILIIDYIMTNKTVAQKKC